MDITSKEFNELREEFNDKLDKVRDAFEEMRLKYNGCDDYSKNVVIPNNGHLNQSQKDKEDRLLKEYEDAIKKWQKADKDLSDFYKTNHGLSGN